jgi:hypothetical protein
MISITKEEKKNSPVPSTFTRRSANMPLIFMVFVKETQHKTLIKYQLIFFLFVFIVLSGLVCSSVFFAKTGSLAGKQKLALCFQCFSPPQGFYLRKGWVSLVTIFPLLRFFSLVSRFLEFFWGWGYPKNDQHKVIYEYYDQFLVR